MDEINPKEPDPKEPPLPSSEEEIHLETENPTELSELELQLIQKTEEQKTTLDRMLRIAAEAENARKRWDREKVEIRTYAIQEFVKDLLSTVDAFERALVLIHENKSKLDAQFIPLVEGIEIVSKEIDKALKKNGVERLPGKDSAFNPEYHQAISKVVDPDITQDTVIEEFVPGYKLGDRIIRTAMVKVASPD